jgi:hypothetical protein
MENTDNSSPKKTVSVYGYGSLNAVKKEDCDEIIISNNMKRDKTELT